MPRLLDDGALEASSVVANCTMNRERPLTGRGGYSRELRIDVLTELTTRAESPGSAGGGVEVASAVGGVGVGSASGGGGGAGAVRKVRWLDLCCGSGRAPAEAASLVARRGFAHRVEIVGLDLVDHFAVSADPPALRLVTASVIDWVPGGRFDLITCVHGLHYVGDKLGVLARIASWLTEDGLFVATFDARSVRYAEEPVARRGPSAELRRHGFAYDAARRLVSRRGAGSVRFPCRYLGADDRAGPNYTGQPAVDSFYEVAYETG